LVSGHGTNQYLVLSDGYSVSWDLFLYKLKDSKKLKYALFIFDQCTKYNPRPIGVPISFPEYKDQNNDICYQIISPESFIGVPNKKSKKSVVLDSFFSTYGYGTNNFVIETNTICKLMAKKLKEISNHNVKKLKNIDSEYKETNFKISLQ
jgi:hypothetical protein